MIDVGGNIRKRRLELKYSQKKVADYIGVTQQAYSKYECNMNSFGFETALKLGEILEISLDDLGLDYRKKDNSPEIEQQTNNQSEAPKITNNKPECDFDDCEIELVQKYRKLDDYGKEVVNLVADAEVKRCEEQNTTPKMIRSFIAAHSVDNHEPKIAYMEDLSKYPTTDEEF